MRTVAEEHQDFCESPAPQPGRFSSGDSIVRGRGLRRPNVSDLEMPPPPAPLILATQENRRIQVRAVAEEHQDFSEFPAPQPGQFSSGDSVARGRGLRRPNVSGLKMPPPPAPLILVGTSNRASSDVAPFQLAPHANAPGADDFE